MPAQHAPRHPGPGAAAAGFVLPSPCRHLAAAGERWARRRRGRPPGDRGQGALRPHPPADAGADDGRRVLSRAGGHGGAEGEPWASACVSCRASKAWRSPRSRTTSRCCAKPVWSARPDGASGVSTPSTRPRLAPPWPSSAGCSASSRAAASYLRSLPLPLASCASTRLRTRALLLLPHCGQVSVL